MKTKSAGIWQGDIIIRTGLIQGLRELRKKPELLDYCFASLPQDELTAETYGQGTIDKARDWFLSTDVPVRLNVSINSPKMPCITVELRDSSEAEATFGDVHYDPNETAETDPWQPVTPVFAATSYDVTTGNVGLPTSITDSVVVFPGMFLIDRAGSAHEIVEAIDDHTVRIEPAAADFSQAVLKYAQPENIVDLESLNFRGTFGIGCHAQGEVEHLIWLRSIVEFILLRYKQSYFEARGLERSTLSATGLVKDDRWGVENVWTTYVNLSGFYKNYWPKSIARRPIGMVPQPISIVTGMKTPHSLGDVGWNMDEDVLTSAAFIGIKGQED